MYSDTNKYQIWNIKYYILYKSSNVNILKIYINNIKS